MFWFGVIMFVVGFATILPSGAAPGSVAHRVVRFNSMDGPRITPGYEQRPRTWRSAVKRVAIGLAVMAAGLAIMAQWFPEGR